MLEQDYVSWAEGTTMPENVEIERRFLVDGRFERPWTTGAIERVHISQWYLDSNQLTISTQVR